MRLAATVILARDAGTSLEVLMLRRSSASAFMPDAYVFPGGTVDASDRASGEPPGWDGARRSAAFRSATSSELPHDQPPIASDDARALLWTAVRELAEEADIRIDPSALHLFSHWITPVREPRRYNTFFFVAEAPPGQGGRADAFETHDARWMSPANALAAAAQSQMRIMYPTIMHLQRLAAFSDTRALLAFAESKPIVTIMPRGLPEEGFSLPPALEGNW
jgi:8-oxo-dGTP pyrophosphatase MutT (NUDIX family)